MAGNAGAPARIEGTLSLAGERTRAPKYESGSVEIETDPLANLGLDLRRLLG